MFLLLLVRFELKCYSGCYFLGKEVANFAKAMFLIALEKEKNLLQTPETVGQALRNAFLTIDTFLEDPV